MITHSLTMFFFLYIFPTFSEKSKFRSREKVDLNFLFILCIYIFFQ